MTTRLELVMLQKTMVVVEGVARKLDPQLDMWATAEPVVGGWIAENLGPRGRLEDVGRTAAEFAPARSPPRRRCSNGSRASSKPTTRARRRIAGAAATQRELQFALALWAIVGLLLYSRIACAKPMENKKILFGGAAARRFAVAELLILALC